MTKKQILLFFSMMIIGIIDINAQEPIRCGTEHQEVLLDRIDANRKYHAENPGLLNNREPIYVPVKFNLLADFDGVGRIRYSAVLDQLCKLNEDYNPFEIYFYLDNNGDDANPDYFALHDNRGVYNDPRTNASIDYMIDNKDSDALNVYVINDAGSSGATTSAGFYSPFGDYIVMEKGQVTRSNVTLTHESGHFFSLSHPHIGWEDTGWGNADPQIFSPIYSYGTTITVTSVSSAQAFDVPVEWVNGNNCMVAGDRICDTPPDYGFGPHQSGCLFTQKVYDRNSEEVKPMENNIMGYFNCTEYEFTEDQTNAVISDFYSPGRSHLRSDYVPSIIEPVVDEPVVISPQNSITSDYYNSVEFAWEPVPNATGYLLEISDVMGNIVSHFTSNTAILVEDLDPSQTYLWFVQPFNELSSCTKSPTFFLFTSDLNTGVNEITDIDQINIYPNPTVEGSPISLSIVSNQSFGASLDIYHVSGKLISRKEVKLNTGSNMIKIESDLLAKGIYVIKLQTEQGIATETLVVN